MSKHKNKKKSQNTENKEKTEDINSTEISNSDDLPMSEEELIREQIKQTVKNHLGYSGKMLSGSKTLYSVYHPFDLTIFNGNIFSNTTNEKLWYGDVNITKDIKKIINCAKELQDDLVILYESDGRFDREPNPNFDNCLLTVLRTGELSINPKQTHISIEKNGIFNKPSKRKITAKRGYETNRKEDAFIAIPHKWNAKEDFLKNLQQAWISYFDQELTDVTNFSIDDFLISFQHEIDLDRYYFNSEKPRINRKKFVYLKKEIPPKTELGRLLRLFLSYKDYELSRQSENFLYEIFPLFIQSGTTAIVSDLLEIYYFYRWVQRNICGVVLSSYPMSGNNEWIKTDYIYVNKGNPNLKRYLLLRNIQ